MEVVIVGHGPSMIGSNLGDTIDSFPFVVRQKRCSETLKRPDDYGTITDAVCGSFTIATELQKDMPGCEYWVFMDSRHTNVPRETVEAVEKGIPCIILRGLCDEWNERYRKSRRSFKLYEGQEPKATSDSMGHTHMSTGLHTILYTCEIMKPEFIYLAGFDNIKTGGFTWSVTRGPRWNKYPDHNWATEHEMIPVISDHFNVRIEYL